MYKGLPKAVHLFLKARTHTSHPVLLPVFLVAVIPLSRILGAVGRLAGVAGRGSDDVVASLAVGLGFLVVRLARLGRFKEALGSGGGVDRGGRGGRFWAAGLGGGFAGYGFVVGVFVPADFFFSRSSYYGVLAKWGEDHFVWVVKERKLCTQPANLPLSRSRRLASAVSTPCLKK